VQPSYQELAALVVKQAAMIESLQAEVVFLLRLLGRDSSNSSIPPSQDGPAAKARAKAETPTEGAAGDEAEVNRAARRKRKQGGQKGHRGTGLERVAVPDDRQAVEPPECGGCGGGLVGAPGRVASQVQVFDIPEIAVKVTEYLMMTRTCGCGQSTTASLPAGVPGGPVCYGPNVVAAAVFLASSDVIGLERAAEFLSALLGVRVSTGFISSCLARLDKALIDAGFEEALKDALRAADVLGTDETPTTLSTTRDNPPDGEPVEEVTNPHVYTVRTMRAFTCGGPDLTWFGAAGDRTKPRITKFAILDGFRGALVRDDFGGYLSYDEQLAGVQQCISHLLRYLKDSENLDPVAQVWATATAQTLREAITAVRTARGNGHTSLDPDLLSTLRHRYDQAVAVGISTNLSRPWKDKKRHPGLVLARRLKKKAHQVWLFTTRFDVPPTNNGSEQAIRGYSIAEKISGCWRTLSTLRRHCRIRSYLTSARSHALKPLDAIRAALTSTCWMPPTPA
jgi:transposase